jgi:uncharacterized protein (TIGR01777 family)
MKALVTGGTGMVGEKLLGLLDRADVVTRNASRAAQKIVASYGQIVEWDPSAGKLNMDSLPSYDVVFNLMGEPIAEGRWTTAKKRRIRASRVQGTRNLVDSLIDRGPLPSVFVSASAVGFYGDPGDAVVTETHPAGNGFLTDVCQEWEAEADRLTQHGVRVVKLRIGIVLAQGGGALGKMLPLFKLGLGGKLGSGDQWMPWIHVDDLVSMMKWSATTDQVSGALNAVAPNPVTNKQFTKTLAAAVNRPAFLPAPKFALRLALGEFANSLFFSQRVVPEAAVGAGFQFQYPRLDGALEQITGSVSA